MTAPTPAGAGAAAPALAHYEAERDRCAEALSASERRWNHLGHLRGLSFLLAAGGLGFSFSDAGWVAGLVGVMGTAAFLLFVQRHRVVHRQRDRWRQRHFVLRRAVARATHAFADLPPPPTLSDEERGPWDDDLDLFGPTSLYQRLAAATTHGGERRLARALAGPADWDEAARRQGAVRELAALREWRWTFEAAGIAFDARGALRRAEDPEALRRWAEAPATAEEQRVTGTAFRALRTALPASLLLTWGATELAGLPRWLAATLLALQAAVGLWTSGKTARLFALLSPQLPTLERFVPFFVSLAELPAQDPYLRELRARIVPDGDGPPSALRGARELSRLAGWFELRNNALGHFLANLLLLWDLQCWAGLEGWRRRHGAALGGWLDAIAELELLVSLAAFADDEPRATFPVLSDHPALHAAGLGHPLIAPDRRQDNDLGALEGGQLLLVTGSNMSGKSTFLRAMGLAVVLAGVGAGAAGATVGPLRLVTSLRVRDSLSSGASHFFAELQKVRRALAQAEARPGTLFLFDELLHGTNARERYLGAQWILRHLMELGALGAVSTHDEQLARFADDWQGRVRLVHFREEVREGAMVFDHRMHAGPVRSGNALRLMRSLGIAVPLPEDAPAD